MQAYDAIVVGAGHNGLTCACYLARAGLRTLVLDQYHTVGGMATTEELTLPGFRSDGACLWVSVCQSVSRARGVGIGQLWP